MAAPTTNGVKISPLDGRPPEKDDYANYFCTYAFLYHQKDMLEDHKRTGAYYSAVMQNRRQFQDKVVLDVGTGSGILSIFAAMAGAKKVYAVEATSMAKFARKLVDHNKWANVIEVIQGTVESIELPEQVDIIISEWMGYFLLRESMLDSVIVARDRFLKPGGALYPSHARMFLAPIRSHQGSQRMADFQGSMEGWAEFLREMRSFYNVSLDALSEDFRREQRDYYLRGATWADVHPSQLLGAASPLAKFDLHKVTLEELKTPLRSEFSLSMLDSGPVDALCGWFDVAFRGSEQNPADTDVVLSTAPDPTGATHWGQQVFHAHPPLDASRGDRVHCDLTITRKADNHRLLNVHLTTRVEPAPHSQQQPPAREFAWSIE